MVNIKLIQRMYMFKKVSEPFLGFLQASGLVSYLIFISIFFNFVPKRFNNGNAEFIAPIMMLLLFIISAVISSLLVLGRSGVLFWERKYREAFVLIGWTIGWSLFYFLFLIFLLQIGQ